MTFALIQQSTKYQSDGTVGIGTVTFSAGLANFGAGRLLVSPFVHYSSVAAQGITSVAYNTTDAATERVKRANPVNDVNQVAIYDRTAVATTGAHNTALTFAAAGAPDQHYVTGSTGEWSYSGTLSIVGTQTNDGNDTAPTITLAAPFGVLAGDLIVACFVLADGTNFTVTSSPSSYTVLWTEGTVAGHESGEAVWRTAAADGAQTITWAISGAAQRWSVAVAVYRDVSSGSAAMMGRPGPLAPMLRQPRTRMAPRVPVEYVGQGRWKTLGVVSAGPAPPGVAVETDTAFALASSHVAGPGVAVETDTAFALASSHVAGPGVAVETDTAFAPGSGGAPPTSCNVFVIQLLTSVSASVIPLLTSASASVIPLTDTPPFVPR